jgi:hypothetical protein
MVCLNFIEIGSNFSVGEKLWNYGTKFAPILEQGNKNHSYLFNFFNILIMRFSSFKIWIFPPFYYDVDLTMIYV